MDLHTFVSDEFGKLDVVVKDGKPLFASSDVSKALKLSDSWYIQKTHISSEHKFAEVIKTDGGWRGRSRRWMLDLQGVHILVTRSRAARAAQYEDWIKSEVIPSLFKEQGTVAQEDPTGDAEEYILEDVTPVEEQEFDTSELRSFDSEEFGTIRTTVIDGEPWFVGRDVAVALGYANISKAIADHVDDEDKLNNESLLSLGQRGGWLINESGLYSLIFSSKLDSAQRFKRWVTKEVLPSIRKFGGYISNQEEMTDEELLSKALLVAQNEIEERDKTISRMRPKEIFHDTVVQTDTEITVGELAKMICARGVDIGRNRLMDWMRENGYLMTQKNTYNLPKQRYVERGFLGVREYLNDEGSVVKRSVVVEPKGQVYFINKFLGQKTAC